MEDCRVAIVESSAVPCRHGSGLTTCKVLRVHSYTYKSEREVLCSRHQAPAQQSYVSTLTSMTLVTCPRISLGACECVCVCHDSTESIGTRAHSFGYIWPSRSKRRAATSSPRPHVLEHMTMLSTSTVPPSTPSPPLPSPDSAADSRVLSYTHSIHPQAPPAAPLMPSLL